MLLLAVPTVLALALDPRQVHSVNVWFKPLKFMLSLALFAAATAWFFDLLLAARRRARPQRGVVWTIVVAGVDEVAYISLQAALGQASHYNLSDVLHRTLDQLMGVGALSLMLTQLVLAQQIARHARPGLHLIWRDAVVLALVLSFVLVVTSAAVLSNAQPPAGAGLPLLGWHLGGGDLRQAHFVGLHVQQLLPLLGWLLVRHSPARAPWALRAAMVVAALTCTAVWGLAFWRGLQGAVWLPPPPG